MYIYVIPYRVSKTYTYICICELLYFAIVTTNSSPMGAIHPVVAHMAMAEPLPDGNGRATAR